MIQEMTLIQFLSVVNQYDAIVLRITHGRNNADDSLACTAQDFIRGGTIDTNAELFGLPLSSYFVETITAARNGIEVMLYV